MHSHHVYKSVYASAVKPVVITLGCTSTLCMVSMCNYVVKTILASMVHGKLDIAS